MNEKPRAKGIYLEAYKGKNKLDCAFIHCEDLIKMDVEMLGKFLLDFYLGKFTKK